MATSGPVAEALAAAVKIAGGEEGCVAGADR